MGHGCDERVMLAGAGRATVLAMLAAVRSAALVGIEAQAVTVEADVTKGLPAWTMVGLPAASVREARERVTTALANSGIALPARRITIGLAPADLRKDGTAFDLPIALALLVAVGALDATSCAGYCFVGEVGLDGTLRPVRGVLPVARMVAAQPGTVLVVPPGNVAEGALAPGVPLATAPTLGALVQALRQGPLPLARAIPDAGGATTSGEDLSDVVGQGLAKRALEIAAAGGHNLLLVGPPGAGKTMLARRLPTLLPPLDDAALLEVVAIHSVGGLLSPGVAPTRVPPFRAPHSTVSLAGLIGGGVGPRPGEVSLAHRGVLLLDEFLELPRHVLDALRQPLEDRRVLLSRAAHAIAFPASFQLVAATNPCPCGHALETGGRCRCTAAEVARYRGRLSGPLADRIDLHITVGAVACHALGEASREERSAVVRARVSRARQRQLERYGSGAAPLNAEAPGGWLLEHGGLTVGARQALAKAAEELRLSARAYHRVVRVARTIADLDDQPQVGDRAVAEAVRLRSAR